MKRKGFCRENIEEKKKSLDFIWPSHHHSENCFVVTSSGNKILSSADPDSLQKEEKKKKEGLKFVSPSEELS